MADFYKRSLTRRTFLGGIASVGAISTFGNCSLAEAQPGKHRIDTHHHFFTPEWKQALSDYDGKLGVNNWTVENAMNWSVAKTLDDMEKGGVTTAVLSLPAIPGNWFGGDPTTAVRLSRICNDYAAGLVRDHPGRLGLWASLPMLDIDASLAEIGYALDGLKADGIGLATSYGDKWLGDPKFRPVFDELNRRKVTVFIHPLTPNCCGKTVPGVLGPVLEVPEDTARAAISLLINGTFAKMKNITWLLSHAGGTLPMLVSRINSFYAGDNPAPDLTDWAPNGIMAELGKLNFDLADAAWPESVAALRKLVPPSHFTFGSDYPYFRCAMTAQGLTKLNFTPAESRAIDYENAKRILPNLKTV